MYFLLSIKPLLLIGVIFLVVLVIIAVWFESGPTLSASEHQAILESVKKQLDSGQPLNEGEGDDAEKKKRKKIIKKVLWYLAGGVLLVGVGVALYVYLTSGSGDIDPVEASYNADIETLARNTEILNQHKAAYEAKLAKANETLPLLEEQYRKLHGPRLRLLYDYPWLVNFDPNDKKWQQHSDYAFCKALHEELMSVTIPDAHLLDLIHNTNKIKHYYPHTIEKTNQKIRETLAQTAIRNKEMEDYIATKEYINRNKNK